MRLSDLQNKDVVDVATGKRIGNVIDAEIEEETGSIIRLIIYDKNRKDRPCSGGANHNDELYTTERRSDGQPLHRPVGHQDRRRDNDT